MPISQAFPDVVAGFNFDAVLDGELLVLSKGEAAPSTSRRSTTCSSASTARRVSKKQLEQFPAHIRLYDALAIDGEDLRALPFVERRARLEAWHAKIRPPRTDLSPLIEVADKEALQKLWAATRDTGIEGIMLKRRDSPYVAGRPKGLWFKWKRAPLTLDCVLMYAQRGSGKRSSYYSDYTFGAWRDSDSGAAELVPVGKAYFGFTDEELLEIDRWVRNHTTESFGPVRAVSPAWCSRWPSTPCRNPRGTSRASPCASPASTASAGTNRPPRRTASNAGGHDRGVVSTAARSFLLLVRDLLS